MPYCLSCGKPVEDTQQFCIYCGGAAAAPSSAELPAASGASVLASETNDPSQPARQHLCVACGSPVENPESLLCQTCTPAIPKPADSTEPVESFIPPVVVSPHSHLKFYVPIASLLIVAGLVGSQALSVYNQSEVTRANIEADRGLIAQVQADLDAAESGISGAYALSGRIQSDIVAARTDLADAQSEISQLQVQLTSLRSAPNYGYGESDPTFQQVLDLMAADRTDTKTYDRDTYNCWNFSLDVMRAAMERHYRCGLVAINYTGPGHAIVAFNTTDRGVVYFEPQSDERVLLKVGARYYQCIVAAPGYYYSAPSNNDTILGFNVVWV